jgi:hypothetical protein
MTTMSMSAQRDRITLDYLTRLMSASSNNKPLDHHEDEDTSLIFVNAKRLCKSFPHKKNNKPYEWWEFKQHFGMKLLAHLNELEVGQIQVKMIQEGRYATPYVRPRVALAVAFWADSDLRTQFDDLVLASLTHKTCETCHRLCK